MMAAEMVGDKELIQALRDAGNEAVNALARALYQEAELIMADSKKLVDVDEGTLRNSGFVELPKVSRFGRGRLGSKLGDANIEVRMGYSAPHGIWLHEGTGPNVGQPAFMPPVAPFKEWAKRVLGDESLGFVIARAVGARGLGPRKFLERPFKARASTMNGRLARRVREGWERGR